MNKITKHLLFAVSSFFVVICVTASRSVEIISAKSFFSALNGNSVVAVCIFGLMYYLFYKIYQRSYSKKIITMSLICAILFSFCQTIGYNIDHYTKLFHPYFNFFNAIFMLCMFLGYGCLFLMLSITVFEYLFKNDGFVKFKKHDRQYKYFSDNVQSLVVVALVLTAFWLIYYFIFFPGIVTWDSYYQIEQGLGFRQLTDENPFLHSLFEGAIIKLGSIIFGTINAGIALFSLFQMICIALAVSFVIKYMAKRGVSFKFRLCSLIFYCLHPIIGAYSVTLWKDVCMSVFLLLYIVFLIEICTRSESFFKSKINLLWFSLIILGIFFSKGTGVIMLMFSFPLLFIFGKKHIKQLVCVCVICLSIFALVRSVIIPALNIQKGYIREPLSVPLQQIARTVKEHKGSISENNRAIINEILPYDELEKLYDPRLSDNVKSTFKGDVFTKEPMKYIKLWVNLGIKYPKTYAESFLSNSYGYWYPETVYWTISDSSYIKMLNFYRDQNWTTYDENINNYKPEFTLLKRSIVAIINRVVRDVPVVSVAFSIATYFWISFAVFLFCLIKKKYSLLPVFFTILGVFITCIMSPVHAEMRYAYTVVFCLPMICSCLFNIQRNDATEVDRIYVS